MFDVPLCLLGSIAVTRQYETMRKCVHEVIIFQRHFATVVLLLINERMGQI